MWQWLAREESYNETKSRTKTRKWWQRTQWRQKKAIIENDGSLNIALWLEEWRKNFGEWMMVNSRGMMWNIMMWGFECGIEAHPTIVQGGDRSRSLVGITTTYKSKFYIFEIFEISFGIFLSILFTLIFYLSHLSEILLQELFSL